MRRVLSACVVLATAGLLAACGSAPSGATSDEVELNNKDPKMGPVFVRSIDSNGYHMTTVKFCDGTTLVFNFIGDGKGGGAAVSLSPECGAPDPETTP